MKKIPTLFVRDYSRQPAIVTPEVTPGCEWVINGEGVATYKYDGTCCMVRDGKIFKRYDAKRFTIDKKTGKRSEYDRQPPESFEPAQDVDEITGHQPGWIPVGDGPEDQWHRQAFESQKSDLPDGTYELCGPKIGTNRERCTEHQLLLHGALTIQQVPRDFDGLRDFLHGREFEGVVFHHPDGRMCKIKVKDFAGEQHTPKKRELAASDA